MAQESSMISRFLLGAVMSTFLTSAALGQTTQTEPENSLDNLLCRDVMIMAGVDRDTTIAFMHGYLTHKRGDNIVVVERIEGSTAVFLQNCLDMPKAKAMEVLEKAFGK